MVDWKPDKYRECNVICWNGKKCHLTAVNEKKKQGMLDVGQGKRTQLFIPTTEDQYLKITAL